MPLTKKKLFLVDAMAHIYRAFYAPMVRMNTSAGVPTTVPFLFNNILRRILKDYQPDYVGIVFDTSKPTFRDKLFEEYKAHRPKMPDELSIQLPFVRRLCQAMRLPILEWDGFEADDVLGALAKQATMANLEVMLVTNDKDMLQLVGEGVKVLRTGTGAAKSDVIVDEKKVEEILGVPPHKVTDVMALMGDSIDNIPGARDPNEKPAPGERRKPGIGEVGAREIILQFGSAEEALRRAAEVKRASYREALQKNGKYVLLSKELSKIDSEVPIKLDLDNLQRREPDLPLLAALYRELGFNSLLKELGSETVASTAPVSAGPALKTDYVQFANAGEFRD
jgi:DNA polymerase-1